MKLFKLVPVVAVALLGGRALAAVDARHYEIKNVIVEEVPVSAQLLAKENVGNFTDGCEQSANPNVTTPTAPAEGTDPLDMIDVIVDKIINIGKKIWAVVDAGRPVVNVRVDTANALPAGVRCWNELESWSAPTSKQYRVSYLNGFGVNVVSYAFRVSFIHGGSYKGQGQYITLASVQPSEISVDWGFQLDVNAAVPMVFNQGTKSSPVAGMQLVMNWNVKSPLVEKRQAENFFINGAGAFEKLP